MPQQSVNRVELVARIGQAEPLRHTPAGTPIVHLQLEYQGRVEEAGVPRQVHFGIQAVVLGPLASRMAGVEPGTLLRVGGFLAPWRQGSDRLVLHVQQIAETF